MNFEEYMNCQNGEWVDPCNCGCKEEKEEKEDECDECLEDRIDPSCMSCCRPVYKPLPSMGRVEIFSILNCVDGEPISGVPFNLYTIENGCEKLVTSQKTDCNGKVEFGCLENGLYRVQQIVDECVFECPEYYPCKEFCITEATKCQRIYVINKLRQMDRCLKQMIDRAAEDAVKKVLCRYRCR